MKYIRKLTLLSGLMLLAFSIFTLSAFADIAEVDLVSTQGGTAGFQLAFTVTLNDTDGTDDDWTWSAPLGTLPGTATFTDDGVATGAQTADFDWDAPAVGDIGIYFLQLVYTDGTDTDSIRVRLEVTAENVVFTQYDTIANWVPQVPLLKTLITSQNGDTLTSVRVRSYIEKEYAINRLRLLVNGVEKESVPVTGRFDENTEIVIAGLNVPFDDSDEIEIQVDAWEDSVGTDTSYHMTGLAIVIPEKGLVFRNSGTYDSIQADRWFYNPSFDSSTGNPVLGSPYKVLFDLFAPTFDVAVTHVDSSCPAEINVGDQLIIVIDNPNEEIVGNAITVDLSAFGISPVPYVMPLDAEHFVNLPGFANDVWTDTIRVGADNLDVLAGYEINFEATDNAGNTGSQVYQFTKPIDTIEPVIDSVTFYISQNNTGPEESAAIDDRLTLIVYMGSNGFFEIDSVRADLSNFRTDSLVWHLDDITNGNNIWRLEFYLLNAIGVDVAEGDSTDKWVEIQAWDNSCNWTIDSTYLVAALDLEPPTFSGTDYTTVLDFDSTNCTNLGDSVSIEADLSLTSDLVSVYADFLDGGLGGSSQEALFDDGTNGDVGASNGIYTKAWRVGLADDPSFDPSSLDAKDANSSPVDADFWLDITAEDDAGNTTVLSSGALTQVFGGGAANMDTRRPTEIVQDSVQILQLAGGKLQLKWPRTQQAEDALYFYVYVDSGDGFDFTDVFGTTFDSEYHADTNAWTSEVLTHNKNYRFVVRTQDDCGNFEFNSTIYEGVADSQAPPVCVVFPDVDLNWGPNNELYVTATTAFTDLDAAFFIYRKTDKGDGTPGPWINYPTLTTLMSISGLTVRDTINLGTDLSTAGHYEAYIITIDNAGNQLSITEADDACGAFTFYWNPEALVVDITTINDAFSPQSECGYDVTRDELNTAVTTVLGGDVGPYYTFDYWVIFDSTTRYTRIEFKDTVSIPDEIDFEVADWPKSSGGFPTWLFVQVTDVRSGNMGLDSVKLCVPDEVAPKAYVSSPVSYSCVPLAATSLDSLEIEVTLDPTGYDLDSPVRCEFYYTLDGTTGSAVKIDEATFSGNTSTIKWNNSALAGENYVWLYAVIHDEVDNTYQTRMVKVCIDETLPNMTLSMTGGAEYADCDGNNIWRVGNVNDGMVELVAEITSTTIDIKNVYFYIQNADSIDIFEWWNLIGAGTPANNNSIWTRSFDTDTYPCGYTYRVRVAVEDNAGNWMLDFDGDGNFDDYTYPDAKSASAGMEFFHDCGPVQPAISSFMTANGEDLTWTNPSTLLGGAGKAYAKMGETLSAEVMTLPAFDSCEVARVDWYLCGEYVGTSSDQASWWKIDFDPFALGILTQQDIEDGFKQCTLTAQMYDKLGQNASDNITVYFLDTISDCPYIFNPQGGSYQWGDIDLELFVIDDRNIKKVAWYYWAVGGDPILIEEVWGEEVASPTKSKDNNIALIEYTWLATWHTLNNVQDGEYMIGAVITDESDNVSDINCGAINVHVVNALPTVAITSPVDGAFICDDGNLFKMDVTGAAGNVNVQYKLVTASDESWGPLINVDSDNFAPWEVLQDIGEGGLSEGFYHFRPVAYNLAGRMVYGEQITLYVDDSNPIARLITVTDDGETFKDLEYSNDPSVSYPVGTQMLTFNMFALDTLSSDGPSAAYNSGMYQICVNYTTNSGPASEEMCFDATVDANGFVDIPWDISGLGTGTYKVQFTAYDNACGSTTMSMTLNLVRTNAPMGLIAGCWKGKIFGVTEGNATVQFQKRADGGSWIPVGIPNEDTGTREYLLLDDGSYTPVQYAVYWADWAPADGDYEVRMLTEYGGLFDEENSPILSLTVADGGCAVTSNPVDYPLGSIERNKENGCDNLEGLGFFETTYGMPYGVAVSYNVPNEDYDYDLISFFKLPQQGAVTIYGGSFYFDALDNDGGGFGMGRVFFVDHADGVAFSTYQHYETYWITRDFGTGGVITYDDGSVTVDIPAEWTDDTGTDHDALAIWKSKMARPPVFQDFLFTPIGDNNGMMTYLTNPYCGAYCGDDEQYAIINMQYDNTDTTPAESLAVAWWDGEGIWHTDEVWFPSTVRGFYQADGQNWVEFAVTCFGNSSYDDAWYAVVKPTKHDGSQTITRASIYPWCNDYTGGYPEFSYQLVEPFQSQINWSSLEIRFDGVRIFEGSDYDFDGAAAAPKSKETAVALHDSDGWYFWFDQVAAKVNFFRQSSEDVDGEGCDGDDHINFAPLDCGEHTIYVRAEDGQRNPQFITDVFNVDCEGPDVDFDNYYVSKNPTINFSMTDVGAGVAWDEVYVDIFFVSKYDTTAGGSDFGSAKERVIFMQTFFPGQIQDYMDGEGNVSITTTYELDDERAILVAIYDGNRSVYYYGDFWDVDPGVYDNFAIFYNNWGGPVDCVGNLSQPYLQILAVDYEAPTITLESSEGTCPMVFKISDDGAGITEWGIYEDGVKLTDAVDSPSEVDDGGEFYYSPAGDGGTLYYCPTSGVDYEIIFTDNVGNQSLYQATGSGTNAPGSLTGFAIPNPFDPMLEDRVEIKFNLDAAATVSIKIYDMGGDLVGTLWNSSYRSAGGSSVYWNGTTDNGTRVANGVYFVHIEAFGNGGGTSTVVKIAVVEK